MLFTCLIRPCSAPLLLVLLALTFVYSETYEDALKKTDQTNAEQVFALSQWCQENNLPSKARQHLFQVIKLDKDHAEARALMGQVRIGERWVAKNQVKEDPKAQLAGEKNLPVGPAPTASEVTWILGAIKDPAPSNLFVNSYIERMQTVANDSREMEVSISTLIAEVNLPTALPRLGTALLRPDFTDLTGPCGVIQALLKDDHHAAAKFLFPYVAKASSRCTEPNDLIAFAYIAAQMHDKRAIPRLIELMNHENKELANAASEASAVITGLPHESMTVNKAIAWWSHFYRSDDIDILRAQLQSKDAETALAAAKQLGALQEKKVIDVLIQLLKSDDVKIAAKAHQLVTAFTGRDWGYVATDPLDQRLKRVDMLNKWWKENHETYVFVIDPRFLHDSSVHDSNDTTSAPDQLVLTVKDLSATDAKRAATAENDLLGKAGAAVPALLDGLSSDNPITTRKCHELLQRISKKSDISFNPRDSSEKKQLAIAAWKAWAVANKFALNEPAEEAVESSAPSVR